MTITESNVQKVVNILADEYGVKVSSSELTKTIADYCQVSQENTRFMKAATVDEVADWFNTV